MRSGIRRGEVVGAERWIGVSHKDIWKNIDKEDTLIYNSDTILYSI